MPILNGNTVVGNEVVLMQRIPISLKPTKNGELLAHLRRGDHRIVKGSRKIVNEVWLDSLFLLATKRVAIIIIKPHALSGQWGAEHLARDSGEIAWDPLPLFRF